MEYSEEVSEVEVSEEEDLNGCLNEEQLKEAEKISSRL